MHTREKPYQLKYCEKRYAQISSYSGMHTGEKSYEYRQCDIFT